VGVRDRRREARLWWQVRRQKNSTYNGTWTPPFAGRIAREAWARTNANEEIAKIARIAGIAKIEKPTPTPLKHGGNGGSGGMKIARYPRQGPTATPGQAGQVARNRA